MHLPVMTCHRDLLPGLRSAILCGAALLAWLVASIQASSIDLKDDLLNAVVRERFMEADKFPLLTFVASAVERTGNDASKLTGELTMLGMTKPLVLNVQLNKFGRHPVTAEYTAGFTATGSIRRSDFGMTLGLPAVGDEIPFEIVVIGRSLE